MTSAKRVLLVFGTRPEAIKMAPVYAAMHAAPHAFAPLCCVTGQHRGLLDQALGSFDIVPDIDLGLMREAQRPEDLAAAVLAGLGSVIRQVVPELVMVHGDTTTTMASALAAFHTGVAVAHVEAGLRSTNLQSPFPEELNRRVTSLVAAHHFAPTPANRDNLLREGCAPSTVRVTGNTVVDALQAMAVRLDRDVGLARAIHGELAATLGFDWRQEEFILVTCHRRESFGSGLDAICAAIAELTTHFPRTRFILPVHPNPQVERAVTLWLGGCARVHLTPPLGYEHFVALLRTCRLVLTDSGGIQEEAPSFGKPVLVMRDVTERPEAVAAGCARLVGTSAAGIVDATSEVLSDPDAYSAMVASENPYGDGNAALRIVEALAPGRKHG